MCHCLVQHGSCLLRAAPCHGEARTLLGQSLLIRQPQWLSDIKSLLCVGRGFNPKCFKCQRWLCHRRLSGACVQAWDWSPRTRQEASGPAKDTAWLFQGEKSWIWWHLWAQRLSVLFPHHLCSDFLWEGDDWFTPEGMNYQTGAAESKGNKLRRE